MNSNDYRHSNDSSRHEELFQLIAGLANCLDRKIVIETMEVFLDTKPVEKDDCVLFDDIALKFDDDGRVTSLYRIIDGTVPKANKRAS